MTERNKTLSLFGALTLVSFVGFQALTMTTASATTQDSCNDIFTYEKTSDYSDARVNINFESNDTQIDVTGVGSYQVTEVSLDVSNDGHSGYFVYANGPVNNFNPNPGDSINYAKVKVKKVCATSTPTATATPTNRPTTAPTAVPTSVPTVVPTTIPTAVPTSVPTVVPSITSVQVDPSVTPVVTTEPTITTTPTVTPTDTPSSSTNNNNNSSSNNSSNNEVKVAGISALASTGGIIDSLMNSVFVSGLITFAFGLKRHGKKS